MSKGDESAFPFPHPEENGAAIKYGLTKRELISAMCMQGLMRTPMPILVDFDRDRDIPASEQRASLAVENADALIAELNKAEGK